MKKREETRITVVTKEGRVLEEWDCNIYESVQDNGRTLKIFVNPDIDDDNTVSVQHIKNNLRYIEELSKDADNMHEIRESIIEIENEIDAWEKDL